MKHGKAIATNGTHTSRVQIFHWWPGRSWKGINPIPSSAIQEANRRGSRYITFATVDVLEGPVGAFAFCCPKDTPDRAMGRRIALGRLNADLQPLGWRIQWPRSKFYGWTEVS